MTAQPTRRATRVPSTPPPAEPEATDTALDFAPAEDADENRAALEASIDEQLGIELPREGWAIDDEEQAGWAARKAAAYRREVADRRAVADREIARINAWASEASAGAVRGAEFFEGALLFYHQTVQKADPEKKSIKLPHADLTSRQGQAKWTMPEDTTELIDWLDEAGLEECFKVERSVKVVEVKKTLEVVGTEAGLRDDGGFHPAPGITVAEGERTFSVKVRP